MVLCLQTEHSTAVGIALGGAGAGCPAAASSTRFRRPSFGRMAEAVAGELSLVSLLVAMTDH